MRSGLEFLKPTRFGCLNGLLPTRFAVFGLRRRKHSGICCPDKRALGWLERKILLIRLLERQPRACKGRSRPTLRNGLKSLIGDIGILLPRVCESFPWSFGKFGFVPVGHNNLSEVYK